ncbi:hypothetical protein FJZ40_01110 [Candidatus Shapirobacteria bacterium]|nr:hypothetical protein [Candidatus Shapirobacteria bacterium]
MVREEGKRETATEDEPIIGKSAFTLTNDRVANAIASERENIAYYEEHLDDPSSLVREQNENSLARHRHSLEALTALPPEEIIQMHRVIFHEVQALEQQGMHSLEIARQIKKEYPDIKAYSLSFVGGARARDQYGGLSV